MVIFASSAYAVPKREFKPIHLLPPPSTGQVVLNSTGEVSPGIEGSLVEFFVNEVFFFSHKFN
jgi:hypothetical protein